MTDKQMLKWLDQLQGEVDDLKKKTSGGGGEKLDTYSTNERVSGTWIDGKPIYKKSFATDIQYTSQVWLDTGVVIPDIADIVNFEIVAIDTYTGDVPANVKACLFRYNNNNVQIFVTENWFLKISAITVWYTKTTDKISLRRKKNNGKHKTDLQHS